MSKLTKTQRACLVDAGVHPLQVIEMHDGYPIKARYAECTMYGRHTLHTLLERKWLRHDERNHVLRLEKDGLYQLPPATACIITSIRCLKHTLKYVR